MGTLTLVLAILEGVVMILGKAGEAAVGMRQQAQPRIDPAEYEDLKKRVAEYEEAERVERIKKTLAEDKGGGVTVVHLSDLGNRRL